MIACLVSGKEELQFCENIEIVSEKCELTVFNFVQQLKMYRKIVWCYVLVLTLLDISLNTKLTAQGKSHDVTVHDSLIEGISFQEWGKEADGPASISSGSGAEALRLSPAALRFGRAALGAAHALTVTLTNTHNATVHLASVAGTTPDFHASFFESKTLPPNGNTSFSVVYLGRREGPVAAHLYIHTSLGVHKYPVSAEGVASEWGVWPLVGLRVPHNATLDPLLTIYNPTDKHIQVREVYSSGSWVGLRLPGGGGAAPREAWRVPPHSERPLVRLRLRLPPHAQPAPRALHQPHQPHQPHPHQHQRPLTAYIRIKGDMVGGAGGLVVGVEAVAAEAGEFLLPPQLRLRPRGSRDPPHTWDIAAGNSGPSPVRVEASVWGGRCAARPPPEPDRAEPNGQALDLATHNGVKSEGAHVTVTRAQLEPHQEPEPALQLTLDYARLWASHVGTSEATESDGAAAEGLWCGGWLRMGASAVPYSVRLLPGTLTILPAEIEVVTANKEEAAREREVRVRNEFPLPLRISAIDYGPDVQKYFHTTELTPLVVEAGGSAVVLRLRLRAAPDALAHVQLRSHVALRTNLTAYTAPLLLHSGTLELEWEWPNSADGHLRVGAVGASSTRRVGVRVRNPTPTPLCVTDHAVRLPHAQLTIDTQKCIPAGSWATAWLTLVAPARAGALTGSVLVSSRHAPARAYVSLHVHAGRLHAHALALHPAAPYAWSTAPLELESTMTLSMRVLNVTQPNPDPAITFVPSGTSWISGGRQAVGDIHYAPEKACAPNCYTGLDLDSPDGMAWLRRGEGNDLEGLRDDVALLRARRNMFARVAEHATNITLYVHTNEVVGIPVTGSIRAHWPRLRVAGAGGGAAAGGAAGGGAAGGGGGALAGVGGAAHVRLRLRNPARVPLVLHPAITEHQPHEPQDLLQPDDADGISSFCATHACTWSVEAFSVSAWRAVHGEVAPFGNWSQAFVLAPAAELELTVTFAPPAAAPLAAYLYLRNNLTIVEIIPLWGRGAYPSFELGGRRPGSGTPLLFEVSECPTATGGGVVRRTVQVHNTGAVSVRLRDWRVAARACQARGFRVQPCAPLALAPNETRALRLAFAPDYTLARLDAPLHVRTDLGTVEFTLAAVAPARLLRACQAHGPRPPFEPALRAAGTLLALAALALVLAAAAIDAERELRRSTRTPSAGPSSAGGPRCCGGRTTTTTAPVRRPTWSPTPPLRRIRSSRNPGRRPRPRPTATARGARATTTARRSSRRSVRTRRARARGRTMTRTPSRTSARARSRRRCACRESASTSAPTTVAALLGRGGKPVNRRAGRSDAQTSRAGRGCRPGARTRGARRPRGGAAASAWPARRRAAPRRRPPSHARPPRCAGAPPGAPWSPRAPTPPATEAATAVPRRCPRSGPTYAGARRSGPAAAGAAEQLPRAAGRRRERARGRVQPTRCSTSTASSRRLRRPRPTLPSGVRRLNALPTRRPCTTISTSLMITRLLAEALGRFGRAPVAARGVGAEAWCGHRPASTVRRLHRPAPTTRSARWPPSGRPARSTGAPSRPRRRWPAPRRSPPPPTSRVTPAPTTSSRSPRI